MREIEFRGKDAGSDKWVFGSLLIWEDGQKEICTGERMVVSETIFDKITVKRDTVGQFTGLYDKNGVKVYENDIVHYKDIDSTVYIGKVSFHTKYAEFCCLGQRFGHVMPFDYEHMKRFEVIGNVFDNPDLYKGERQ
jgi:uncharacterized phage protein (TIGR01671 family)